MQAIFIEWEIFGNSKAGDVTAILYADKNIGKLFYLHLSTSRSIANELWVSEIGGVEKMLVEHVDVEMYQDMRELSGEISDFIYREETVCLSAPCSSRLSCRDKPADSRAIPADLRKEYSLQGTLRCASCWKAMALRRPEAYARS